MPLLLLLHDRLATALVLYLLVLALWGLVAWRRGRAVGGGYLGALLIAEAVALLQGALGAGVALDRAPHEPVHVLYGLSIVVALPLAVVYARDKPPARQSLTYALFALFAFGLAVRGMTTGR